jgi:hypothetical protein
MPVGIIKEAGQVDDEFVPSDARPVCPNCLKPCNPLQNYFDNCDSNEVINPLASYMPLVRIRFNIVMLCKIWRRICYDEHTSLILKLFFLFIITLGVLFLPIAGLPLLLIGKISEPKLRDVTIIAFWVIAIAMLMVLIYFNIFARAI